MCAEIIFGEQQLCVKKMCLCIFRGAMMGIYESTNNQTKKKDFFWSWWKLLQWEIKPKGKLKCTDYNLKRHL